jgi:Bacterial SH3 domain
MQHPHSYGTILVIVVSALSLVAGLVVVMVTSPDSIKLGSQLQGVGEVTVTATTLPVTAAATDLTPSASATLAVASTPTSLATTAPFSTATLGPTATLESLFTATPELTPPVPVPVVPTLAPDAVSVGIIKTDNNSTARLRSQPSLDGKVVEAIQQGEYVQVLGPVTKADDIDWLPIRHNKTSGWVAKALVSPLKAP